MAFSSFFGRTTRFLKKLQLSSILVYIILDVYIYFRENDLIYESAVRRKERDKIELYSFILLFFLIKHT